MFHFGMDNCMEPSEDNKLADSEFVVPEHEYEVCTSTDIDSGTERHWLALVQVQVIKCQ